MQDRFVALEGRQALRQYGDHAGLVAPGVQHFFQERWAGQQAAPVDVQLRIVVHDIAAQQLGVGQFARRHQEGSGFVRHHRLGALESRRHHGPELDVLAPHGGAKAPQQGQNEGAADAEKQGGGKGVNRHEAPRR